MSVSEWWHQPRPAKRLLLGLTVLTLLQAAALAVVVWPEPEPWDPIVPFAEQAVMNEQPIGYDGVLIVQGKKCYREDVTIVGQRWWATERPPGTAIPDGGGSTPRPAGCMRFYGPDAFQNAIPVSVAELDHELREQGIDPVWYIFGTEHAVNADGESSVERTWRTESFRFSG